MVGAESVALALRDPHLLEGTEKGQDTSTNRRSEVPCINVSPLTPGSTTDSPHGSGLDLVTEHVTPLRRDGASSDGVKHINHFCNCQAMATSSIEDWLND